MADTLTTAEQLKPTNPELQQATIKALDKRVSADDVRAFLDKAAGAGRLIRWAQPSP